MKENDLRVIKTKEIINSTLIKLLKKKPVEKITVTELAKEARINRGTFYLHYQDIRDLYEQLILSTLKEVFSKIEFYELIFISPIKFLDAFQKQCDNTSSHVREILQSNREKNFQSQIIEILVYQTYSKTKLSKSDENDIKLHALFGALLTIMPLYYTSNKKEVEKIFKELVKIFA